MKSFLNEERKPLKDCSDEEKLAIFNELCEKGQIAYFSKFSSEWFFTDLLSKDTVYRTTPKQTKVFWDRAFEWARYLVINEGGGCFLECDPVKGDNYYCVSNKGQYAEFDIELLPAFCELGDEKLPLLIERPEE